MIWRDCLLYLTLIWADLLNNKPNIPERLITPLHFKKHRSLYIRQPNDNGLYLTASRCSNRLSSL